MGVSLYATTAPFLLFCHYLFLGGTFIGFIAVSVRPVDSVALNSLSDSKPFDILPVEVDYVLTFDFVYVGGIETVSDVFLSL